MKKDKPPDKKFLIVMITWIVLIGFLMGWCMRSFWREVSPQGRLEREYTIKSAYSNNYLASISSPLGTKETIVWELCQKYDFDYKTLYDLAECEASLEHKNKWGDDYQSFGGFQWCFTSWEMYNRIFNKELNMLSFKDQAELTILTIQRGDWWNWANCCSKIKCIK